MKIAGDYVFEAPQSIVWEALLDPVALAATLPGCDKLEREGTHYEGDLNVKVGPVQGKFHGKIDLSDVNEPQGYTINVDGRGQPGFVKAVANVKLSQHDDAHTKIEYDADAKVGGRVASVGQRLLDASARAIIKQSLEGLNETVKARAEAQKASAASGRAVEAPAPKRVSESQMAAAVAREVSKTLVPAPVAIGIVVVAIGVITYLFLS
ncbi:MAG: carbon monoxide dehydrogenase subunit G [Myxococcota bacterium]